MTRVGVAAVVAGVGALLGGSALSVAAVERPEWVVVERHPGWELRRYAPRLEARVTVEGDSMRSAANRGFRVLADFIFGNNEPAATIEMTAPVTTSRSTSIAMTAPVGTTQATDGRWVVSFTMPRKWTLETLPRPVESRIEIVEVPGGTWAASTFRGRAYSRHEGVRAELESELARRGVEITGPVEVAQYNPPWTPPPLRRNEVLVPVSAP